MYRRQGEGWRVLYDQSKVKFPILIGGDNWSIELTYNEYQDFYCVLKTLDDQIINISKNLMDEEVINLEFEKNHWYGELDGKKSAWSLRFIHNDNEQINRSFEFSWPQQAASKVTEHIKELWDSLNKQ
tara:strand:- start:1564 stop:1947 length:384 start_codon:yes stop_codon:yes gene_type:complete